ncbi:MAG: exodeoxyribonuclease small subunit [Actinomycetota bacterium]|jgi:exodeoxyribonuclease VII small subunit|nr:exodeoxyribonuclease small subunit [Actinomycetota bacterium]
MTEEVRWADAIAELETILVKLDDDALDVDVLAAQVARAAELIGLCRDRIARTKLEVERIVGDLDTADG